MFWHRQLIRAYAVVLPYMRHAELAAKSNSMSVLQSPEPWTFRHANSVAMAIEVCSDLPPQLLQPLAEVCPYHCNLLYLQSLCFKVCHEIRTQWHDVLRTHNTFSQCNVSVNTQ